MAKETIHVVGAGPAGLVAAINLKRQGYDVVVHEAESEIGGPPSWHPSVHITPIDYDLVEDFIGIDLRPAFKDVMGDFNFFNHNQREPIENFGFDVDCMDICIRGPHEKSLDNFLYQLALKEGVEVIFNDRWGKEEFDAAPEKTIVATGFGQGAYEALGYKFTPFYGFWTREEFPEDHVHISIYKDDYTNEYGYSGAKDGVGYALIFARGDITPEGLEQFKAQLQEQEHYTAEEWGRFTGATTRYPRLFDRQFIFAGTASGFMGPAQGYGILAALLGGKIAAMAVDDPEGAKSLYEPYINKITKHISMKFKEGYKPTVHFRKGNLWMDIPTIHPEMTDAEALAAGLAPAE